MRVGEQGQELDHENRSEKVFGATGKGRGVEVTLRRWGRYYGRMGESEREEVNNPAEGPFGLITGPVSSHEFNVYYRH